MDESAYIEAIAERSQLVSDLRGQVRQLYKAVKYVVRNAEKRLTEEESTRLWDALATAKYMED